MNVDGKQTKVYVIEYNKKIPKQKPFSHFVLFENEILSICDFGLPFKFVRMICYMRHTTINIRNNGDDKPIFISSRIIQIRNQTHKSTRNFHLERHKHDACVFMQRTSVKQLQPIQLIKIILVM